MSKRTLLMVVSIVAALALAATGTLAYLTDTDSDVNVMTLGNVDIEQHEMKRAEGVAYNATLKDGDLVPFEDGIKLYPAYPTTEDPVLAYEAMKNPDDGIKWGPYVHDSNAWNGLWSDENVIGAVDKMVFVENTGSSDAYVRTILAFEKPEGVMIGWGSEHADIVLNMNGNNRFNNSNASGSLTRMCEIDVDGVHYEVYEFCYSEIMKPGEWTRPSLLQVVMTHWADNDTMELLGETYEILALSQGVQVENLTELGAQGALDAAFGKVNEANATEWFSAMEGLPVTIASNAEELAAALAEGGNVLITEDIVLDEETSITIPADKTVVLDLGNKTITGSAHKNVGPAIKNEGSLTIKGGVVESTADNGGSAIINNGTLTVEGTTINGAPAAGGSWPGYTINNTGVLTLTDCDITSVHGGLCSYGSGAVATLNDCTLDMTGIPGFTSHGFYTYSNGKIVINGGTYANKATDQNATGASVINGDVEITDGTFSGRIEAYYGKPSLSGGTYSVKPNSSHVADGRNVVDNGDGTWSVK